MKINNKLSKSGNIILKISVVLGIGLVYGAFVSDLVSADSIRNSSSSADVQVATSTNTVAPSCPANPSHLQTIITKGNEEIGRRQNTLSTLTNKIDNATHLTTSDKTTLSTEVGTTISGLATLKGQLVADTNVCSARNDALSIYTEYRVYAIVAPKIELIKVADDQLSVQANLNALSTKLQTRITADQNAGKNVTTLQNELNSMNGLVSSAGAISTQIESAVINLEPTDYNTNHSVLVGDSAQLKIAHQDDQTAYSDAKTIVAGLKVFPK